MYVATSMQMKKYDQMLLGCGSTIIELVDMASAAILKNISKQKSTLIICGPGNNGADGLALACRLLSCGTDVIVYLVKTSQNEALNYYKGLYLEGGGKIFDIDNTQKFIFDLRRYQQVIDAIYGFSFHLPLAKKDYELISLINDYAKNCISIDIPSGMCCDYYNHGSMMIIAKKTITFVALKRVFMHPNTKAITGKVIIEKIDDCQQSKSMLTKLLRPVEIEPYIEPRKYDGYKGMYGRVLHITGSKQYRGAAVLCARAALHSGSGGVCVYSHPCVLEAVVNSVPECTLLERENQIDSKLFYQYQAVVIGSGLGLGLASEEYVMQTLRECKLPLIIDGDALTIVSKHKKLLKEYIAPIILTPHHGEFKRFLEPSYDGSIIDQAIMFAREHGVYVVLKGPNTLLTDGVQSFYNCSGNKSMAVPGMGDVLAGMISCFVAQTDDIMRALKVATYLHGKCGDVVAQKNYTVMPSRLIEQIPEIMYKMQKKGT